MGGGEVLEEEHNKDLAVVSQAAKQPAVGGWVLWFALGACTVWLIAVGIMLILKLTETPIPPDMIDYTCPLTVDIPAEPAAEKKKPSILPEYKEWYDKNHDMVGWLKIDGTNVDYPVMQSKGFDPTKPVNYAEVYEKNMYWLKHDFDGEYSYSGSVTAEYCAHIGSDYRSPNILLYGHNMSNFFP